MKISLHAIEVVPARYPEDFEDWRLARIEYYDSYGYCKRGYLMWVPPNANLGELEELFNKWQEK